MAAMEAANAHYQNGHHQQQSGPQLPASPTLTNPDMILPDYDRSNSPDSELDRADHAMMMWKNAQASNSAPDMHQMFVATGLAGPRPYGPAGPVTPTTPIIYGNGTMLSDIGEVTEVESTVGRPTPARTRTGIRRPGSDGALRPSPTISAAPMSKKKSKQALEAKRERRSSMESTSTITTGDHAGVFADFDDSVSVGDSVFQGDDEESMASSYVEGTAVIQPARLAVARVENIDRLSTYSTTSLSRRAEEILANAKKRLTTMEGNLTRARSTLPYYESEDGSTPSPTFQRASTAMYPLDNGVDSNDTPADHTPGHARMSSELAMRNGLPYRVSVPRSQSALGAAGGYRQPLTASKSADHIRGGVDDEPHRPIQKANSVRETGPKLLTEDEVARLGEADRASQNARLEAFLSPTFGSFQSDSGTRNPQRSSSAAQMRDIKDQMKDLKGKISSLREQARMDNMKRRSLQSLRTPSPFTQSQLDPWHTEPPSNRTSGILLDNLPDKVPWDGEGVDGGIEEAVQRLNGYVEDDETDYADAEEVLHFEHGAGHPGPGHLSFSAPAAEADGEVDDDISDMQTENGDMDDQEDFHDADDADYMSESGESLYHDSVQEQISHEDREDAFDYEHFFLHSAMGTMSRARRASTESLTSEDSVETTRGPVVNETNGSEFRHAQPTILARRNSSNSISTIDTFATAQEVGSLKSPVSPDESWGGTYETSTSSSRATSAQSHRYRSGSTATSKRLSFTSSNSNSNTTTTGGPAATRDSDGDGSISPIAEESSSAGSPAAARTQSRPPSSSSSQTAAAAARRASVIHHPRPMSTMSAMSASSASLPLHHRPSSSSFDSVGTNRSFPLVVNKAAAAAGAVAGVGVRKASSTGVLTPSREPASASASPDGEVRSIVGRLMCDMGRQAQGLQGDGDGAGEGGDGKGLVGGGGEGLVGGGGPHPLEALLREDKYLVERIVASLGKCVLGLTENGRASAESRMFRRRLDAARRVLEGVDSAE